jgi:hypothetical protein
MSRWLTNRRKAKGVKLSKAIVSRLVSWLHLSRLRRELPNETLFRSIAVPTENPARPLHVRLANIAVVRIHLVVKFGGALRLAAFRG